MTGTRLERAERAQALRGDGALLREIAATLGISVGYAGDLVADPTGEKVRQRKESYRGRCERCGAATDGSNGRGRAPRHCLGCATSLAHEQRRWRPETIVEAIQRFAAEHGRQPTSSEWLAPGRDPSYPAVGTVQREFGSWAAAVEAAGFPRPERGLKLITKTLVCVACGQAFTSTHRTTRYCSACRWKRARRPRVLVEGECCECGAAFTATGPGARGRRRCYDCRPVTHQPRPLLRTAVCADCGSEFMTLRYNGQGHRKRCYDCAPLAAPGRSPSTLRRARRREREAIASFAPGPDPPMRPLEETPAA